MSKIALEEVKQGKYSPQQYLDYLTKSIESIKEAKNSGMLLGIVYLDHLEERRKLEILWKELWEKRNNQEGWQKVFKEMKWEKNHIEEKFKQGLERFLIDSKEKPSTLFSIYGHTFIGEKLPNFILGHRAVLQAKQDEDVKKSLFHELHHLRDDYLGVKICDYLINRESFVNGKISVKFYRCLHELRAYYHDLYGAFLEKQKGVVNYSNNYLHNVVHEYFEHYSRVLNIACTPFEKRLAEAQLKEFQNIVPQRLSKTELRNDVKEGFTIRFNIGEKPEFFTLLMG